jgi:hypothetical protein
VVYFFLRNQITLKLSAGASHLYEKPVKPSYGQGFGRYDLAENLLALAISRQGLNHDLGYQVIAGGAPMAAISPNRVRSVAGEHPVGHINRAGLIEKPFPNRIREDRSGPQAMMTKDV